MDAFSYLSVLLSIIIGLGITEVLQGYRSLLLSRSHVKLYAPTIIWSALLLVFSAQLWWASFGLASHTEWSFATFGVILLQTVLLYMMSAIVIPDVANAENADLRTHYFREVTPFFTISLLMLASSISKDYMLNGRLPSVPNLSFHAFFAGLAALAIASRKPSVHVTIALGMVFFTIAYIALLFARLGQS